MPSAFRSFSGASGLRHLSSAPTSILHPSPENLSSRKSRLSSATRVSACCPSRVAPSSMFMETASNRACAAAAASAARKPPRNHLLSLLQSSSYPSRLRLLATPTAPFPSRSSLPSFKARGSCHVQGEVLGPEVPPHPPHVFPCWDSLPPAGNSPRIPSLSDLTICTVSGPRSASGSHMSKAAN